MPYMLDGNLLEVETEPVLKDGTLWVPFRKLGEALGGTVDWEPSTGVAILYIANRVATLQIGDKTADVDGEQTELQAAPYAENGESWVPVRFFEKALGYTLSADPENGILDLTTPAVV